MRSDATTSRRSACGYEDLVAAADVVVSKPGYGIVSECIANGASLLYTSRGHSPKTTCSSTAMPRVLRCRFIAQDDLRSGSWDAAIQSLLAQPAPAPSGCEWRCGRRRIARDTPSRRHNRSQDRLL